MNSKRRSTPQDPGWSLRAFRPGDEPAIVELFQLAFQRHMDVEHWRWKLKHLPSPAENVWLAVDADDRPVFHYAGIPCSLDLPDGRRRAMISVDTMTDPAFQRRGLLSACGPRVYEAWREAGIDLVLGLPNQRWGSRARALDWQPLFPLQWQIRPLRPDRILARRLAAPGLTLLSPVSRLWNACCQGLRRHDPTLEVHDVEKAGEELDAFAETCRSDGAVSVVRGSQWIRWRYLSHPSHGYRVVAARRSGRLAAYLVYRVEDNGSQRTGFIAELVAPQSDAAARRALLASTVEYLRAQDVDAVFALAVPKSDLFRDFRRAGFLFTRGRFMVQCVPLAADLDLDVLRDPRRWRMNGGDFDVV